MCMMKIVAGIMRHDMGSGQKRRERTQAMPGGVTREEHAYLPDGDRLHMLDVYRPEGAEGALPLVFNIHGGAWVFGDKDLNRFYAATLAKAGFAVVSISYRLLPETDLKGQVADIAAAAKFTAEHAEEFGADTRSVMLTGDSAGAHLSSLYYSVASDAELAGLYGIEPGLPFDVRCLVLSHGVGDIHELLLNGKGEFIRATAPLQRLFDKGMFGKKPLESPLFARSSIEEAGKNVEFPPVMLIGCDRDVYLQHTLRLKRYFSEKAPRLEFFFTEGEAGARLSHVYNILRPEWEESRRANDASLAFFRECMAE